MYNRYYTGYTESMIPQLIYEKERNDYEVTKIIYDFAVSHIHLKKPHLKHPHRHKK